MKRRTAIVTTSFPHDDGDPSGHFVHAHALALAREGREVHVIAPHDSVADGAGERFAIHPAGGSSVFQWPGALSQLRAGPWRAPAVAAFALGVRRQLRRHAPFEHAVGHWLIPSVWPLLRSVEAEIEAVCHGADIRLLTAAPHAVREHVVVSLLARQVRFKFVAGHLLRRLSAGLTPATARALLHRSEVRAPLVALPPAHRRSAQSSRARLGLGSDEPFVVLVARLVPSKRIDLGLEALARLAAPPRTVIVGDGPERKRLVAHGNRLGLHVTFTGRLSRHHTLGLMSAASALLHPSGTESAPTAVLEARQHDTPVIACAAGDLELWAERDPLLYLAAPSATALAAAVARAAPELA